MRFTTRPIAFIACLISLAFGHAWSQNLEQSFVLGKTLFENGDLIGANALLSRVAFFDETEAYKSECYHMLAQSNLRLNIIERGFKYYEMAIITAPNAERANDLVLEKSLELVKRKRFMKALQELYSLSGLNQEQQRLCDYLTGVSLYGNKQFKDAEPYFLSLVESNKDSALVSELFDKIDKKLNARRPKVAYNLSYLPGLGQLYAGNVKGSINSIALITGIAILYVVTIQQYGLISGIITVMPWLSRYYVGGLENAKESMQKRQDVLTGRYFNELLLIVN